MATRNLRHSTLLLLTLLSTTNAGLWDVSIDIEPAPSPEDGPPFSAHASRDRGILPYQIIGIVASYLGFVLILGTFLLTVGRTARKRAQTMAEQPTEMTKPVASTFDMSPRSPSSMRSWVVRKKKSRTSSIRSGGSNKVGSPGGESVASFDANVIQEHKQRANDDMARIYGAYYEFEDQRQQQSTTMNEDEAGPASPPRYAGPRPILTLNPNVQRIQTSEPALKSPLSPTTPRSMRAIYPPSMQASSETAPIQYMSQPQSPQREARAVRTSSIGSGRTNRSERTSGPNKLQKSIRGGIRHLKISGPYQGSDDNSDDARTPLSPASFADPGPPPEPPVSRTAESQYSPITPASERSAYQPAQHYQEPMDKIRDVPLPYPQRGPIYNNEAQILTDYAWPRPNPIPESSARRTNAPAASVNNQLPFRQYASQKNLAAQTFVPLSPSEAWKRGDELRSPTKVTELELGRHKLAGIASPLRSAYEPPTPRTPFTPRLVTRAERKQKEKEDKVVRGPIMEEDQVADDKDLWSSGY